MVNTIAPQITSSVKYMWELVRDCVRGEKAMKDKAEYYLPRKGGQTDSDYYAYKARAKWADYTEQALNAMHGMIFRRAPSVEVPDDEQLRLCLENFNHEGDSLYQFASTSCYDNMQTSFGGYLVDMPQNEEIITMQDAIEKGLRPYCKYYPAEKVRNWKFRDVNGVQQLSMVVLQELVEITTLDEFSHDVEVQYRILDLDENNMYRVRIYREFTDDKGKTSFEQMSETYVIINGQPLNYIPFIFAPSKTPEKPMLYGLAELNKHYYMQSADYENGVHFTTIPTGYSTGHTPELDSNKVPVPIRLGADSFIQFSEDNARIGTLVFAGEGLQHCETAMEQTMEQVGVLGTRSIAPDKNTGETSDAAKVHRQGENARLATYARNISEVFTKIIQIMADWLKISGKVNLQFNVDFDTVQFDPNTLNSIANLSREGKYPLPLVFEALKKGEYLPNGFTFEQYVMLIDLERAGATSLEILDAYTKMRSGEKFEIDDDIPISDLNAQRDNTEGKPVEDTKQVSLETGK